MSPAVAGRVVVVDPYSSGATIAPALRKAGLEPVCVTAVPAPAPTLTATFRPADFSLLHSEEVGLNELVDTLRPLDPVAVVPGTESGVTLADQLAAALTPGRANDPALTRARRHKGDMVSAVAARGLPAIRTTCVARPEDAGRWVVRSGLTGRDLVVKPSMSAGTEGVTLVPGCERLDAVVASLLGRTNLMGLPNDEIVVQERIHGTEYVIDTFSFDGRVSVTDVCRYTKVSDEPAFAAYESIEVLPFDAPEVAGLVEYTTQVLDALGIRFGLAHTEVMMTTAGPVLIETAARPAGADLPALCELATGDNGIRRLARYLAGGRDIPLGYRADWFVAGVYFRARASGVAADTAGYRAIEKLPSCRHLRVNIQDGDAVPATTDLMSTLRLGWAVLAHHDAATVRRDLRSIRQIEQSVVFA